MNFDPTLSFNISRKMMPERSGAWLIEGPKGHGLMFGNIALHNTEDPVAEAESWLEKAIAAFGAKNNPSLAIVFGLGLGYHFQALRRKYPEVRILVFEPISDLRDFYENNKVMTDANPPAIFTDWQEFEKAVSREVVYGKGSGFLIIAPEGYKVLRPEAYGAFNSYVRQEIIRRSVIERTRETSGADFLNNLAFNAGRLVDLPDLLLLKGLLPPRPAFIVGSGPSLKKNAAELKALDSQGLIIAAASAVRPLLSEGVSPDIVLILESTDTSSFLDLNARERTLLGDNKILALASSCHPAHFDIQGFVKAIFHLSEGAAQIFSHGVFLPQGGNSGSAGFALAYVWGMDPIVLLGQDQAYEGGRLHADGTPGEVNDARADSILVNGINGQAVETNTGLLASLGWFAEAAKTIARQENPPRLFNCSAGGAEVFGFVQTPLETLISSLAPASERLDIVSCLLKLPRSSRKEIVGDIEQLALLINNLRRLVRMDYRKAYAEVKEAGKLSRFLGQILAEAAAASGREELLSSLNKADEFMTVMRSALH